MREIIHSKDMPGKFLVGLFTLLFLLVLWPYVAPLFWAVVLAVLLRPLWNWMVKTLPGPSGFKAFLMLLGISLVLVVPFVLIILALPGQINTVIEVLPQYRDAFVQLVNKALALLPPSLSAEFQTTLESISRDNIGTVSKGAVTIFTSAASSTISLVFQLTLMLYVLYYFFTRGPEIYRGTVSYLPFSDALMDRLAARFVAITKATVGGVFAIAIAQGLVAMVIFWMLGVKAAVALGVATMVVSLLPAVGSGLVWIPVAIFLAVNGEVGKAIILVICGVAVIGMVDNLLRPRLIGSQTQIPDFVVLLTTLGGLSLLGTAGIVLGPMIAGLCISLWQMTKPVSEPEEAKAEPPRKRKSAKA